MRKLVIVLALAFAVTLGDAHAQSSNPARPAGPRDEPIFLPLCHRLVVQRDTDGIAEYCGAAAQLIFIVHGSEGQTPQFSPDETQSLLEAAWANGVSGIHNIDPERPIEFVPMAADADNMRIAAYSMMAAMRRANGRDIVTSLSRIATAGHVVVTAQVSVSELRRQVMSALLAQRQTPERLWAITAVALSMNLNSPNATPAQRIADIAELERQVQSLHPNADSLTGVDAVVPSLIAEANAVGLYEKGDYAGAAPAFDAAAQECAMTAWAAAHICVNMRFEAARARFRAQDRIEHPQLASAQTPPASGQFSNPEPRETRPCRVLTSADIADDGSLTNIRVVYEDPPGLCTAISAAFVASRRFPSAAQGQPGVRRVNLLIPFERRAP